MHGHRTLDSCTAVAMRGLANNPAPPDSGSQSRSGCSTDRRPTVLTLGVLLLILAVLFDIGVLWTIGGILTVIGLILAVLGVIDRSVGPRRYYW